ncbi:alpha-2-macroglobulin isoform X2 [Brienomyrus brachyistius]|uniref:alpha-2-macroglobulin isoform X2 n=1 Tax=Brienomyrus brachyistius TaxID=42636 RepID=UPI0020B2646D|nr:alpha-2-macroglobulin isoform X2 [Brienomyrus brachyistius]
MCELLLIFVLLQAAGTGGTNVLDYLVTVTSQAVSGSTETVCVHLESQVPVTVNISLLMEGDETVVLMEEVVAPPFYRCVPFQIPAVFSHRVATLHATFKGPTEHVTENTRIFIIPSGSLPIMQTDKPIYKPGQEVMFRIATVDFSFLPLNQKYKTVELKDSNHNRIAQWLNQSAASGILDFSYRLSAESPQGSYVITAWDEIGRQASQSFEVQEFVLQKFEVKVHLPAFWLVQDTKAALKVCGKYTYGKPVQGSVKAKVCLDPEMTYECMTYNMTTDRVGCASQTLDPPALVIPDYGLPSVHLFVESELEESGTGVIVRGSTIWEMYYNTDMKIVFFEKAPATFRRGILYEVKLKAIRRIHSPRTFPIFPVANELINLRVNYGATSDTWTQRTNREGIALFSLNTSHWAQDHVKLQAYPQTCTSQYCRHEKTVKAFFSKSNSYLKIMPVQGELPCDQEGHIWANYIIQGAALQKGQDSLYFYYLVFSRGHLVLNGQLEIAVKEAEVNTGELTVPLRQIRSWAPYAQLVIYTLLPTQEIVADSDSVPIQKCFNNKVSLKFPSVQELPGEETLLELTAHPGSLCSLRAIDQSILLMAPEQELTVDWMYSQLPLQRLSGYHRRVKDEVSSFLICRKSHNDIYSVFKKIGVKVITSYSMRAPGSCRSREPETFKHKDLGRPMSGQERIQYTDKATEEPLEQTVRTYFPETWIWDLVPVGDSGSVNVTHTLPDTITKWVAGAFCTSPVGFGLAPSAQLTAYQPFFVSLTLPYSVVRGEVFTLKASVFSYLPRCIMVQVSLMESAEFTAQACEGCKYKHCVCEEESRTFRWILKPAALGEVTIAVSAEALRTQELCGNEVVTTPERGRIDTVVRKLLVEAEGTKDTITHNALLCLADGPVEKDVSVKLPEVHVEGSVKAFLSVLGDLMGRAMQNLDRLLAMPYGCGEQNMVLFAPNIYILRYLESTKQLTKAIQEKAICFLKTGYQRELNYKHNDGSYSAFGKHDQSGNTWLTAFVLKSFGGASPYIFVDPRHIGDAKLWLHRQQNKNGCFRSVGKLFNNGMKGGVSDEVSLTAYITAALLEIDRNTSNAVLEKSLSCLRNASGQLENLYLTALLSYTFTLAGDHEMRSKFISYLAKKAKNTGHWELPGTSGTKTDSLAVEMTSYVLLALLSGPMLPDFGLSYMSGIVRWLSLQQNPYGGFSSTQDTVVALQALSLYSATTFSPEGESTVVVSSAGGYKREFVVNQHNRLLYQEDRLTEVPGEYSIKATGRGCTFVQIALHYHIPAPADFTAFSITAKADGLCDSSRKPLTVSVGVRYNGKRDETNMVIIKVKLLSGYSLDKPSREAMLSQPNVKRVEEDDGHIFLYVDELTKMKSNLYSLTITEDVPVRNRKPAVVKVYDYYQTSDEAVSEYSSPCADSHGFNEL